MTGRTRVAAAALVAGVALAGCVGGDDPGPAVMTVSAAAAPMDEPVAVRLTGLGAGRRATVTATTTDFAGTRWSAAAVYQADDYGSLDLGAAPVSGAYRGADPMGLFEFMTPDGGVATGFSPAPDRKSYDVRLTATVDGRPVAAATATRLLPAGLGVTDRRLSVARDGVAGVLYRPKDTSARKPAVLVFGGSEGGLNPVIALQAAVLAAHGYPTLALAYFHGTGLPPTLAGIPLEYFRTALQILRTQPGVDPGHLLVTGQSYGGEASLLIAATYPDLVHGVIAVSPNSYVDPDPDGQNRAAWSLRGRDLPRGPFAVPAAQVDPRALIPVRRIRGPIQLACGPLDGEWPACRNIDDAVARLGDRPGVTVAKYADAGHYVGALAPYTSVTDGLLTKPGGTVAATLAANVDLHRRVLALLAAQ